MLRALLPSLLALLLGAGPASGAVHGGVFQPPGGSYGGPGDRVPGGSQGSGPEKGAPTSGAPAGPDTGAPRRPSSPGAQAPGSGGPALPTPSAPGAPVTGGVLTDELSSWNYWWELNKEPLLSVKESLYTDLGFTGHAGFFLGHGLRQEVERAGTRPSPETLRGVIVPALLRALGRTSSNDVMTACLIALAKIGEDAAGADTLDLERVLRPFLRDPNQEVAETAAIALGILGRESSAQLLSELALDSAAGREALRETRVPVRTRAFATYALGLIGQQSRNEDVRRFVVGRLARVLTSDETPSPDVGVAAVLAMGLVPLAWKEISLDELRANSWPASAWREAQVAFLLELLRDRRTDRLVRAHVPTSLGRLLADAEGEGPLGLRALVTDELLDWVGGRRRRGSKELVRSVVLALGHLADGDADALDRRVREVLLDGRALSSDRQARRFALLAAAQAASRPGQPGGVEDGSGAERVRAHLHGLLARGTGDERSWAALALGLLERRLAARGELTSAASSRALEAALRAARQPSELGALALACGIARDEGAVELLLEKLQRVDQDEARAYTSLALGLLGAPEAVEPVRAIVEGATYRPGLLYEAATALVLLEDRDVAVHLARQLRAAGSQAAQAALAKALGRTGDEGAVEPLVEMLADEELGTGARAFAAVALGIVADKDPLPWSTQLALDVNYTAAPVTLYDSVGYGVLNLL